MSQEVKSGVRDVPGGKGSPRDPRGSRGASEVYQRGPWSAKDIPGGQGGLQGCQGVKGDVRGVQGGGQGESRGSKVLRGKLGVYHGVKAVARGFQGVSGCPRGRQGYPGGSRGVEVSQGVKRGVRGVTRVKGGPGVPGGHEG